MTAGPATTSVVVLAAAFAGFGGGRWSAPPPPPPPSTVTHHEATAAAAALSEPLTVAEALAEAAAIAVEVEAVRPALAGAEVEATRPTELEEIRPVAEAEDLVELAAASLDAAEAVEQKRPADDVVLAHTARPQPRVDTIQAWLHERAAADGLPALGAAVSVVAVLLDWLILLPLLRCLGSRLCRRRAGAVVPLAVEGPQPMTTREAAIASASSRAASGAAQAVVGDCGAEPGDGFVEDVAEDTQAAEEEVAKPSECIAKVEERAAGDGGEPAGETEATDAVSDAADEVEAPSPGGGELFVLDLDGEDALTAAYRLGQERWVADDPEGYAVFEDEQQEARYHQSRSRALHVFVQAFQQVHEAGARLMDDHERVQKELQDAYGEIAYQKVLLEEVAGAAGSDPRSPSSAAAQAEEEEAPDAEVHKVEQLSDTAESPSAVLLQYLPAFPHSPKGTGDEQETESLASTAPSLPAEA